MTRQELLAVAKAQVERYENGRVEMARLHTELHGEGNDGPTGIHGQSLYALIEEQERDRWAAVVVYLESEVPAVSDLVEVATV